MLRCAIAFVLTATLLIGARSAARAQDSDDPARAIAARRIEALEDMEAEAANPNAPLFALGWRNQLTARLGAPLRAYREAQGWLVRVDPAVELFNLHGLEGFPYQTWRGLLSIHVSHRSIPEPTLPLTLAVRVGVAHESDHQSAPDLVIAPFCGWAYTNTLFAELRSGLDLGDVQLSGALRAGWHFYSFTRVTRGSLMAGPDGFAEGTRCSERDAAPAFEAAQNIELTLDLMLRTGGAHMVGTITFCAAAHLDVLPASAAMYEEMRAVIAAGGCYRDPDIGELQLLGELWLGSYVGLVRFEQFPSAAAMFRWSV